MPAHSSGRLQVSPEVRAPFPGMARKRTPQRRVHEDESPCFLVAWTALTAPANTCSAPCQLPWEPGGPACTRSHPETATSCSQSDSRLCQSSGYVSSLWVCEQPGSPASRVPAPSSVTCTAQLACDQRQRQQASGLPPLGTLQDNLGPLESREQHPANCPQSGGSADKCLGGRRVPLTHVTQGYSGGIPSGRWPPQAGVPH